MTKSLKPLNLTSALTLLTLGSPVYAEQIKLAADAFTLIGGAAIEEHAGRNALVLGKAEAGAPFGFGAAVLNGIFLRTAQSNMT